MPLTDEEKSYLEGLESKRQEEGKDKFTNDQVVQALRYLHKQNETLAERMETIGEGSAEKDESEKNEIDPNKIESMSQTELAQYIVKQVASQVVAPVKQEMENKEQTERAKELKNQVDSAAEKHDDFWDFRDEIRVEVEKNPTISVDNAYTLAKANNPDKAKRLDGVKKEAEAKEAKEKEEPKFGGFLPTSGVSKATERMDKDQAAETAWEEHMADFKHIVR